MENLDQVRMQAFYDELQTIQKEAGVVSGLLGAAKALKGVVAGKSLGQLASGAGKYLRQGAGELAYMARSPGQALQAGREVFQRGAAGGRGVLGGVRALHQAGVTRAVAPVAVGYGAWRVGRRVLGGSPQAPQQPAQPQMPSYG